ncbi:MAG: TonB family protein [Acidobacteria bacterium]|nr:TonB family protein [Acidobacteriota bacterium]MCA1641068.1 TonB family protein [Acidobacteriota bacterium]
MKGSRNHLRSFVAHALALSFLLLAPSAAALAQGAPPQATDPDTVQRRIVRARALAAAGNLPAARSELESLRGAATDESVREIALVLLMGIYFEQSDYAYAEKLLDDAFRARAPQNESATRAYFLLAGQSINGVRAQLDRYRAFGLDASDRSLPDEAVSHLDRLRKLIEHVVEQGRQLREESARSIDAAALLENASSARVMLARDDADRTLWQNMVADVRQKLTGVERRGQSAASPAPQQQPAVGVTQAVPEPTHAAAAQPPPAPAASPNAAGASGAQTQTQRARPGQPAPNAVAGSAQPVEVGSLISRASQTVAPSYPAAARNARIGGKVTVYLLLDEKGSVAAVQRSDGPEMLRRAAEDAARRWRFHPTLVNGQPARVTGSIVFNFAPER